MPSTNPFVEFADSLHEVAREWPQSLAEVAAVEPYGHRRYDTAMRAAQMAVGERVHTTGGKKLSGAVGVGHGLSVIGRFYHNAAASAVLAGVPFEQVSAELRRDSTHNALLAIASLNDERVKLVEGEMNLLSGSTCTLIEPLERVYVWHDERLSVERGLVTAIAYANEDPSRQPTNVSEQCNAMMAGVLKPIFESVLIICEKDQSLLPYTMAGQTAALGHLYIS